MASSGAAAASAWVDAIPLLRSAAAMPFPSHAPRQLQVSLQHLHAQGRWHGPVGAVQLERSNTATSGKQLRAALPSHAIRPACLAVQTSQPRAPQPPPTCASVMRRAGGGHRPWATAADKKCSSQYWQAASIVLNQGTRESAGQRGIAGMECELACKLLLAVHRGKIGNEACKPTAHPTLSPAQHSH